MERLGFWFKIDRRYPSVSLVRLCSVLNARAFSFGWGFSNSSVGGFDPICRSVRYDAA
jgi:hypothetical protein